MKTKNPYSKLPSMNIFIKTMTGKAITVAVEPEETVSDLKQKILEKEQIPVENQMLVFSGKVLSRDDAKLGDDCNIQKESTIHLVMHLGGGVEHTDMQSSLSF